MRATKLPYCQLAVPITEYHGRVQPADEIDGDLKNSRLEENLVHHPVFLVQEPLKHQGHYDRGKKVGKNKEAANGGLSAEGPVEEEGDAHSPDQLDHDGTHGENHGPAQRSPEISVFEDGQIVLKA